MLFRMFLYIAFLGFPSMYLYGNDLLASLGILFGSLSSVRLGRGKIHLSVHLRSYLLFACS